MLSDAQPEVFEDLNLMRHVFIHSNEVNRNEISQAYSMDKNKIDVKDTDVSDVRSD